MWFKSKTQHADPEVRRRYVQQLPAGDESLLSAAIEDPHPDVRVAAVTRLDDLSALQRLAGNDPDPQIRAQAMARLQTVLSGSGEKPLPLERRCEFAANCDNPRLLAFLARSAAEPQLRRQALDQLLSAPAGVPGSVLCDVAADDPVSELREAAAAAIVDEDDLAALMQRSRGRDKNTYRTAQRKLEELQARNEAAESLRVCVDEAEGLRQQPQDADLALMETRLAALEADFARVSEVLDGHVDPAMRSQFESAASACRERIEAGKTQRRRRTEILDALQRHVDGQGTEPVAMLSQRWHELGEPAPAEARRFEKLVHAAHEADSQQVRELERTARAEKLIAEAESLTNANTVSSKDIEALARQWEQAPLPEDATVRQALLARFDSGRQKLLSRMEREKAELQSNISRVEELLDRYEKSLAGGQLRVALSAHDKAASALAKLAAPVAVKKKLEDRLHSSEPKMSELRRWRHWGTQRAREALCKRAEALVEAGLEPPAVARQVRECRDEWKKLDKADGAANKSMWERFDGACEKAYAPCEAYFEQQKQQRAANMEQRVAICVKLEELAAATDWDNPPWRELADGLREAQRDWHRSGPVDRRRKRGIEKRYREATAAIESRLETMRVREVKRREDLVTQVEGVTEQTDLRDAIRVAKQAQRDWKPLVQADRKTERELWKRFRTACDAVFERRKSEFEAADKEREQNLAEKKSVCDQIEQMTATLREEGDNATKETLTDTRRRLTLLRSGWQRIGQAPRAEQSNIERRFRDACEALEKLGRDIEKRLERAALDRQRELAAACDGFELAIAAGDDVDEEAVREALAACTGQPSMKPLAGRLQRVLDATGDDQARSHIAKALEKNLAVKQQICLELEIAANIDSPPEHQEERMAWRVNQLSASLSGDRRERTPEVLEQQWLATGAVPVNQQSAITARFERAIDALGRR